MMHNPPRLQEPKDYFRGLGHVPPPTPLNILLFTRESTQTLQQKALQNRSHHRFVLIFNLETRGHVHVNHLVHTLSPGQILLIHPYQFHHFSHLESDALHWLICTFELEPASFLESLRGRVVDEREASRQARDDLVRVWRRCTEAAWPAAARLAQLQVAVSRVLLHVRVDAEAGSADLPPEPSSSLLRSVNQFMQDSRGHVVVVGDLARAIGMSESAFRSRFRADAGIPVGAYLQNYRLHRAMALLRTSERSIADIAEEAGFGSHQAFSRIFRKKIGVAPRTYRQH